MSHRVAPLTPAERFVAQVRTSLSEGTFLELSFSMPASRAGKPHRMKARLTEIRGQTMVHLVWTCGNRDTTENQPLASFPDWLARQLQPTSETSAVQSSASYDVQSAMLKMPQKDLQWHITGKGKTQLTSHKPSLKPQPQSAQSNPSGVAPAPQTGGSHDRTVQRLLDESANDWLTGLGVLDAGGQVKASMLDKYHQIQRYLEIVSHHWDALQEGSSTESQRTWRVVDVGCGKAYLTFALWHGLHRIRGMKAEVVGIERREDLVQQIGALAGRLGAVGLRFEQGSIEEASVQGADVLVALHACNTATDAAIRKGVDAQARMIIVAPCCHQELRPLLRNPDPLAGVLKHGLMKERMAEWMTDGLRALFLEAAGYRVKMIEFASPEHTPKNLLIIAVRTGVQNPNAKAREDMEKYEQFFGLDGQGIALGL